LSPEERSALAALLAQCEECRRYAEMHVFLSRHLHLEAVRTQPAPEFKAAILHRAQSQYRRNLIMNPIRTAAAVAVLAAVLIVAWLAIRSNADNPADDQTAAGHAGAH
jgi:anti-sigma factor RsiW